MKKAIALWVFLVSTLSLQAQNTDSLLNVLDTQTPTDQIFTYCNLSYAYIARSIDTTIMYAKKGLELAEREKDTKQIIWLNAHLGLCYEELRKQDSSLAFYNKALDLAIKTNDKQTEKRVYGYIGNSYRRYGSQAKALEYYLDLLPVFEKNGDTSLYIASLNHIANLYRALNNIDRAIYYYEQEMDAAKNANDSVGICGAYYGLSGIFMDKREYDKSMEYNLKVLEISRNIHDEKYQVLSLLGLGRIYKSRQYEDYEKALEYAEEALKISKKQGSPSFISASLDLMANIYLQQRRFKESEETALKAWELDSSNLEIQGKNIMSTLVTASAFLGKPEEAAYYFWRYDNIVNQFSNKNFQTTLMDMEVKYETEKKELRISALEKEKTLYIWLGVAATAVLLLILVVVLVNRRLNVQKRKLAEQQVKQLEQEKQLIATQAVLDGETAERSRLARDLHDGLGGMLSVVKLNLKDAQSYTIVDGADVNRFQKAVEMLDQSISELRRVAHHMMPESLMRYGLKVSLEDFCRAIPSANFQYFGDNSRLDSRLEVLIYRCAYELINNAVKHANATNINVQLMIDNGVISLTVHDNGVGFDPEKITPGAGLENIRARVAAYNGKMNIHTSPGKGTEISIEIESV